MQTTIKHLFQVPALEDVPRERLESFVEEYPFFGYGHYLLTLKLRAENSDEFTGTAAKTSLHFSNPFWLEWLLVNAPETRTIDSAVNGGHAEASPSEPEEKDIWSTPEMLVELEAPQQHTGPVETESGLAETQEPEPGLVDTHETEPGLVEGRQTESWLVQAQEPEPAAGHMAEVEDTVSPAAFPLPVPAAAAPMQSTAQQLLDNIEEAKLLRESLQKINEDFHTHVQPAEEPIHTEETIHDDVPIHAEEPIHDEEPPFVLEEQEPVTAPLAEMPKVLLAETTEAPAAPPAEAPAPTELSTPAPTPAGTEEPALIFEPYHTIDYFASQGIKLTIDENPSDQLGKQLKSFTEWLRVMRRLPQKEKEIVPDRVAEQEIQSIAAHSIEGKEVLTETMAEVLAKQGMPERARIVYEKLSLLNPGKSAYFAAKIEQLNSH